MAALEGYRVAGKVPVAYQAAGKKQGTSHVAWKAPHVLGSRRPDMKVLEKPGHHQAVGKTQGLCQATPKVYLRDRELGKGHRRYQRAWKMQVIFPAAGKVPGAYEGVEKAQSRFQVAGKAPQ
jgi:hypothetical protein